MRRMYKLNNTDGVKSHGLLIASVNSWLTNEAKPVQRRLRTKCTAVFIERETVNQDCFHLVIFRRRRGSLSKYQIIFSSDPFFLFFFLRFFLNLNPVQDTKIYFLSLNGPKFFSKRLKLLTFWWLFSPSATGTLHAVFKIFQYLKITAKKEDPYHEFLCSKFHFPLLLF